MTPREKALKSIDCAEHTCNNFKAVNNAIDIALQEQIRIDEEKRQTDIEQIFKKFYDVVSIQDFHDRANAFELLSNQYNPNKNING